MPNDIVREAREWADGQMLGAPGVDLVYALLERVESLVRERDRLEGILIDAEICLECGTKGCDCGRYERGCT